MTNEPLSKDKIWYVLDENEKQRVQIVKVADVASAVRLLQEKIDANPLYDHLKGQSLKEAIKQTVHEVFGK